MSNYIKYPRTPHLPWSPGVSDDDITTASLTSFDGHNVVVSEKMDGENTSLYSDHSHARSLDSRHHSSRDWLKQWHSGFAHDIPAGWRICGENLYARHSVPYVDLLSYFYGFSIWNNKNQCLSWPDTLEWFDMLNIRPVPVIYCGPWSESLIREIVIDESRSEGYVIRKEADLYYGDFRSCVAKWVRTNHVQTDKHWMHKEVIPNGLEETDD